MSIKSKIWIKHKYSKMSMDAEPNTNEDNIQPRGRYDSRKTMIKIDIDSWVEFVI